MTLHKVGDLTNDVRQQQKLPIHKHKLDVVVVEDSGQILETHMCNAIAIMPNLLVLFKSVTTCNYPRSVVR